MSLPYLIVLIGTILLGPKMLLDVYLPAREWQRTQISVDNAATVMAKADRALFNKIILYNKKIKLLEIPHHTAHLCKDSPFPWISGPCAAADLKFELSIQALHSAMQAYAKARWLATTAEGVSQMKQPPLIFERSISVPIHSETCQICGLRTYIEVDRAPVKTFIRSATIVPIGVLSEVGGNSLKRDSKWNYKLKTGEERL